MFDPISEIVATLAQRDAGLHERQAKLAANGARIDALQARIDALTAPPAEPPVDPSDPRPQYILDAPLMTWTTIPGTRLDTVLLDPRGISNKRQLAQCGAALRTKTLEAMLMTGGHADGCSNSVYSIPLADEQPRWVRRNEPTPTELIQTDVSHYLDGRPSATHTGWTIQYNADRDLLMRFGATSVYGGGGTDAPCVDAFDPNVNDWLPAGSFPDSPIKIGMDRPTAQWTNGDIYQQSQSGAATITRWSNETGQWSTVGGGRVFERGPAMVPDPDRNRLVRFDRYRPTILPLDDPDNIKPFVGPDYSGEGASHRWNSCPAIYSGGKFLRLENGYRLWSDKRTLDVVVYETDPETFETSIMQIDGEPPKFQPSMSGIIFGRFMRVDALGILLFIVREDADVYFVRIR